MAGHEFSTGESGSQVKIDAQSKNKAEKIN